ncbi:hypothetical protein [Paraburkholderia antibiotica]|uniref:Uncharacterized protein n=1 Tax=Paraburkholderia antibiotica TaxID=2728839 RepID=A0A7X9ZYI4_9BURK|nr:hypothetical protein [Paraburkholderia antibiotica]NML31735.1 hypothetical protein [Paraburkholderia antibiotica]
MDYHHEKRRTLTQYCTAHEGRSRPRVPDDVPRLHGRLIGSFFAKARYKYEKRLAAERNAINDKVPLYEGRRGIDPARDAADLFQAIENVVQWEIFAASVREAE